MPRVLVVNNYSLDRVWDEVKIGQTPDQYLFGINYFSQRGYDIEHVPLTHDSLCSHLQRGYERLRIPIPLGHLEQQRLAWLQSKSADLIYAPCQSQTHLLGYLKAIGLFKKPVVCIAHQPVNPGRLAFIRDPFIDLMINAFEAFPSITARVSDDINKRGGKSIALSWAPDKKFFPVSTTAGEGIVTAGRTGRDLLTFGQAASKTGIKTQIICLQGSYLPAFDQFADNVNLTVRPDDQFLPYPELVKVYAQARALAIPLYSANHSNGISSLLDALGMGKPVIMTRNPYIDVDIEGLGIGKCVEIGDQNGWIEAMRFFDDNPQQAVEMGKRARALVDAGLNSETFANQVMDIFDRVLNR